MAKPHMPDACAACGGALDRGYLFGFESFASPTAWVATPVRVGAGGSIAPTRAGWLARRNVEAWRCEDCGRLELYAGDRADGR